MKTFWYPEILAYNGSQLKSHWVYEKFGLLGDALAAFCGPCDVGATHMVDLVDRKNQAFIHSDSMLHFIGEFFGWNLRETILLQRNLVSLAQQELMFRSGNRRLIRGGNDLWDGEHKLSVSIATVSQVSTLVHFGINISSKNTPVPTKGLEDYGIVPEELARPLMETFRFEVESVSVARSKVRAVE